MSDTEVSNKSNDNSLETAFGYFLKKEIFGGYQLFLCLGSLRLNICPQHARLFRFTSAVTPVELLVGKVGGTQTFVRGDMTRYIRVFTIR